MKVEQQEPPYVLVSTLRRWCSRGPNILLPIRMSWLNIWEFILTITSGKKWFPKCLCFLSTWTINRRPFKSWKYLSAEYTTSLYSLFRVMPICFMPFRVMPICVIAFSRYAYLRYAYFSYAFLRYTFSSYAFSRYAFYHSVCLSAFWQAAWYLKRVFALQRLLDAFRPDLKHRISLLLFSFGLMHIHTIWIIWYQFLVIEFCHRYTSIIVHQ